ncbi:MAG TPA: type II toxin-antitoxin system YoeB family toxin [Chitinophagaceae bacterium]|nr:type II toxin-antitoxin system YoeB family toxin [Chitinophagaceae bacterium]
MFPGAFEEYRHWIERDRKTALRIGDLIRDILRDPVYWNWEARAT